MTPATYYCSKKVSGVKSDFTDDWSDGDELELSDSYDLEKVPCARRMLFGGQREWGPYIQRIPFIAIISKDITMNLLKLITADKMIIQFSLVRVAKIIGETQLTFQIFAHNELLISMTCSPYFSEVRVVIDSDSLSWMDLSFPNITSNHDPILTITSLTLRFPTSLP